MAWSRRLDFLLIDAYDAGVDQFDSQLVLQVNDQGGFGVATRRSARAAGLVFSELFPLVLVQEQPLLDCNFESVGVVIPADDRGRAHESLFDE